MSTGPVVEKEMEKMSTYQTRRTDSCFVAMVFHCERYGLPKIHKLNSPFRLIVSSLDSLCIT